MGRRDAGAPFGPAPSAADVEALARVALAELPEELRRFTGDVLLRIEEFPDDETLDEMGMESEFELLGLYRGVSLDRQSVHDVRHDLDMILLYRRPLLDYWCGGEETLEAVVRHVLIHEIGHHFGLSDEDMERIEADAG